MTVEQAVQLAVVAWLPGAVIYRMPVWDRDRRAALPAEERAFWAVILSVALSLGVTMALAAMGQYRLDRLMAVNLVVVLAAAAAARFRLRLGKAAPRPGAAALIPLLLVALMAGRAFPPAEYIIGGKDPGTYMNEGIQIAQRGSLVTRDRVVASVPPPVRDLFFPSHDNPNYYSLRFMGFFVADPQAGIVVGQFPHLFPASIAIAYGVDGLTGARRVVGFWAVLGILAVYFVGVRSVGRAPAAVACVLLALHVLQVWYARYPNSEIMMQALLLAAVLAADRALDEASVFFGVLAGVLLGMQWTLRFDVALAVAAVCAAAALAILKGRRMPWSLFVPLVVLSAVGLTYLATLMTGYSYYPLGFTRDWMLLPAVAAAVAGLALLAWAARRPERSAALQRALPAVLVVAALAGLAYAWLWRTPEGRTAAHDAYALRTFATYYLYPAGLIAAAAGFAYVVLTSFWRAPAFLLTATAFALFFFYKIRVVPEHFWMGRRFVAVILPAALLFIAAIALSGLRQQQRVRVWLTTALGAMFLVLLGIRYAEASRPVVRHVEYAGIIPRLEALAAQFTDGDLVIVESRDASEAHLLALPLAYVYARNVLVLTNPVPDKHTFGAFLTWAESQYSRIFFLGGGGTDLVSHRWRGTLVTDERFTVPEYLQTGWETYPRGPRDKKFAYALYRLQPGSPTPSSVDLDIGGADDLHVVRFHSKELTEGRWIRWTRRVSYVSLQPVPEGMRRLTVWMGDGGRPETVARAQVSLELGGRPLGEVTVDTAFRPYTFEVPADAAASLSSEDGARLTIRSTLWNPHAALGTGDDRELGVMVDRIRID